MGRHRPEYEQVRRHPVRWAIAGVAAALAMTGTVAVAQAGREKPGGGVGGTPDVLAADACPSSVRVVTSSSFAPVLAAVSAGLRGGGNCLGIEVSVVDGRAAATRLTELDADVWIPDDGSWAAMAGKPTLAEEKVAGSGTVLAASPLYLVADGPTAERVSRAGGSWSGLAGLLGPASGVRLALREPSASGDGMVGAGSLGEAVWTDAGMDASALALATALPATRTVADPVALPRPGEVGVVPEYALLPVLDAHPDLTVLGPKDHTALLRFTWLPTAAGAGSPDRAVGLRRLLAALTAADAGAAYAEARLRRPAATTPPGGPVPRLPVLTAAPFDPLKPHHVDHVFASWYRSDRRTNLLLVVDVSGSMAAAAPGGNASRIDLVRSGVVTVGELLPDEAALGLWEFGSRLDPPRDYRALLASGPMKAQRPRLAAAADRLTARRTGTGLYDTILAAYTSAASTYRAGVPNQVLVFTDGRNEDDPGSITADELSTRLAAAAREERPIALTVVAIGEEPEVEVLRKAMKPVDGYVASATTADDVSAVFVHVAAGGVHG